MTQLQVAPYGSWRSPITAELVASAGVGLGSVALDGDDVYWIESRPAEGGRNVIVRRSGDGHIEDVLAAPFNARTRVHEYGGGAYAVDGRAVVFANYADQRLYRLPPGGEPRPLGLTVEQRFADIVFDRRQNRIICVREDHRAAGHEATNAIVGVPLAGGDGGSVLVSGADFYASP